MVSFEQEVAIETGMLIVGAAQPFVLRKYVDTQFGSLVPQLGVYGTPSALIGIVAGGVATAAALVGKLMNVGVKEPLYQNMLLAYGVPALVGSIAMAAMTATVKSQSMAPQGVFRPQQGAVGIPRMAPSSAAQQNYQSLTRPQQLKMSVY